MTQVTSSLSVNNINGYSSDLVSLGCLGPRLVVFLPLASLGEKMYKSGFIKELTKGKSANLSPFKPLIVKTAAAFALFVLGNIVINKISSKCINSTRFYYINTTPSLNDFNVALNFSQLKTYFTSWFRFFSIGKLASTPCNKLSNLQLHYLKIILSESAFAKVISNSGNTLKPLSQTDKPIFYLNKDVWKTLSIDNKKQIINELQGSHLNLLKISITENEFNELNTSGDFETKIEPIESSILTDNLLNVLSFKALVQLSEQFSYDEELFSRLSLQIATIISDSKDEPEFDNLFNLFREIIFETVEPRGTFLSKVASSLLFQVSSEDLNSQFKKLENIFTPGELSIILTLILERTDQKETINQILEVQKTKLLSEETVDSFVKMDLEILFNKSISFLVFGLPIETCTSLIAKTVLKKENLEQDIPQFFQWFLHEPTCDKLLKSFIPTLLDDERMKLSQLPAIWKSLHIIHNDAVGNDIERPTDEDYQTLEVERSLEFSKIRTRYRQLQRRDHPDRNLDNFLEATEKSQKLSNAFERIENWENAKLQIAPDKNPLQFAVDSFLKFIRNNKDRIARDNPWPANEIPFEVSSILGEVSALKS